MQPNLSSPRGRLAALDELRGVAMLAVLASHVGLVFGPELEAARALTVPALGVGVDLFFVISGFVVAENVGRLRRDAQGAFWGGASAFWGRRALRIGLPVWTVAGLIVGFQASGVPLGATDADLKAAGGFYANFHWASCFEGEAGCGAPLAASHFWSLANEMQFYLVAPFLLALRPAWTASICLVTLIAGALFERPWGGFWWTFRADGLVVGVLISLGAAKGWRLPKMGVIMASFWLLIASLLARILGALASGFALAVIAMIFGFVVASAAQSRGRPETPSALQRLGELSFSIYLVHLPIMTGAHEILGGRALPAVELPIAIVTILLGALLLDRWITRLAQILGRRFSAWVCGQGPNERQSGRVAA